MARDELPARWGGTLLLLKRLATGGMAEVYLAVEEPVGGGDRFVVVKRAIAEANTFDEYDDYLVTEGRISLKCHHPNLPAAYHLGREAGRAYLVLEYVHGHVVTQLLRALATRGVGLDAAAAVAIGIGAARALEHLHELAELDGTPLGVIHRDVSPHNLIVASGGTAKLIDLGIARAALQTHQTSTGVVKGKYAYMAPEQLASGVPRFDARADLFSLGVVLHELLVGRALFQGASDLDTCQRVQKAPIAHPSDARAAVPRAIGDVVMTALARDPDERWPSAGALADALEDAAHAAGAWPSPRALWDEVTSLLGPAPRPELDGGQLVWRDARALSPRLYPRARAQGTVMEVIEPDDTPVEPIDDAHVEVIEPPVEPIEPDLSGPIAPPPPAMSPPTPDPRRDPALSYYLHVGAVNDDPTEEQDAPPEPPPAPLKR